MTAIITALICVVSPIVLPIGAIPISLSTFMIYLTGMLLGAKYGSLAVFVYILIGMTGIPVFSGFSGGMQKIAGATGGYIVGYLPCVACVGLASGYKRRWILALGMAIGTAVLYGTGTAWFMFQSQTSLSIALTTCVLPFLPLDIAKGIAAYTVSNGIQRVLPK